VNAKFVCASCKHSGSTNDIIAWGDSNLYQMLEIDGLLPDDFFFIGDEAFTNTQQFLSPWPGKYGHSLFYVFCVIGTKIFFVRGLIYIKIL